MEKKNMKDFLANSIEDDLVYDYQSFCGEHGIHLQ